MKRLLSFAFALALVHAAAAAANEAAEPESVRSAESAVWPAFFAVSEFPASPDVVGLRLTLPFSTRQENVTGVDVGLWGRALYFEGFQLNLLRNDVKDTCAGIQVGLYNSIGSGELAGIQVGLWNEAGCIRGAQVGLVNATGEAQGIQVGLINRCETMYGFQIGLINVIREAEVRFFPICNIGF